MDYKYIEQLLDRYWECATTPVEESILRSFFSQKDVPAELEKYKSLFVYENAQAKLHLDESFDNRVLAAAGIAEEEDEKPSPKVVKIGHVSLATRLRPLFRAAAAVAIVTLLGTAAQHSFNRQDEAPAGWDYNGQAYKDSYDDPQKAYEAGMKALEMFKQGPQTAAVDSTHSKTEKLRFNEKD